MLIKTLYINKYKAYDADFTLLPPFHEKNCCQNRNLWYAVCKHV